MPFNRHFSFLKTVKEINQVVLAARQDNLRETKKNFFFQIYLFITKIRYLKKVAVMISIVGQVFQFIMFFHFDFYFLKELEYCALEN